VTGLLRGIERNSATIECGRQRVMRPACWSVCHRSPVFRYLASIDIHCAASPYSLGSVIVVFHLHSLIAATLFLSMCVVLVALILVTGHSFTFTTRRHFIAVDVSCMCDVFACMMQYMLCVVVGVECSEMF